MAKTWALVEFTERREPGQEKYLFEKGPCPKGQENEFLGVKSAIAENQVNGLLLRMQSREGVATEDRAERYT